MSIGTLVRVIFKQMNTTSVLDNQTFLFLNLVCQLYLVTILPGNAVGSFFTSKVFLCAN